MIESVKNLRGVLADAVKPPPDFTISEWADSHRVLDSRSSSEPGPWRTDRTPYLRDPMDAIGPSHSCKRVVLHWATQLGKTEALLNTAGYYIDAAPCPIMLIQPTKEAVERFSRQRVTPLVEASPRLRYRVADMKSRDSANTLRAKEFRGGVWVLVGANSPTDLASTPVRILLCDEVDRWPPELGAEGDPLGIAERRTATFHNRKVVLVSSPTVKGESRVESEFARTDQRHYVVPCPHCGTFQRLKWSGVKWPAGQPELASYQCAHCAEAISHIHKSKMLAGGYWEAEDLEVAEMRRQQFDPALARDPDAVGYHLSTLYSPWFSWADMAREFVRCAKDPVLLRVFVNTLLGEPWDTDDGEGLDAHELFKRREDYGPKSIPAGVAVITAGVDIQADRAVVEVVGWGRGEESWSIEYVDVYGDPSVDPRVGGELWEALDRVLSTRYDHELGGEIGISAVCIDTGHQALNVYAFVRPRQKRRIWGVKGKSGDGSKLWPRSPTRRNKGRIDLYIIGTVAAKESIYARLRIDVPGPGYCHFTRDHSEQYFAELTAERKKIRYNRGRRISFWELPSGRRNEALDCRVYAFAALHGWRSGRNSIDRSLETLSTRSEKNTEATRKKTPRRAYLGRRRDHWLG